MKVYVAAPWTHKAEAQAMAEALEAAGHTITKKWWEHREVPGYLSADIPADELAELIEQSAQDIKGVLEANAFVLVNLEKSEGKAVETGVAVLSLLMLANGMTQVGVDRLILVGEKSNLFHYVPFWEVVKTTEGVVAALGQ